MKEEQKGNSTVSENKVFFLFYFKWAINKRFRNEKVYKPKAYLARPSAVIPAKLSPLQIRTKSRVPGGWGLGGAGGAEQGGKENEKEEQEEG